MANSVTDVIEMFELAKLHDVPEHSVFFTRVLSTSDARTWPGYLFPSRVSFLRLFHSKNF